MEHYRVKLIFEGGHDTFTSIEEATGILPAIDKAFDSLFAHRLRTGESLLQVVGIEAVQVDPKGYEQIER